MNARTRISVACISYLLGAACGSEGDDDDDPIDEGADAEPRAAEEPPRVDQAPHRIELDPSAIEYALKQPLQLSKLDPKKLHIVYLHSRVKSETLYARKSGSESHVADAAAHAQYKDADGNDIYVSKLTLKANLADLELVAQFKPGNHWAALLLCDEVVTNGNDSGVGSLRTGIANARNDGSVCFDPAVFGVPGAPQVALAGEILVGKNVHVHGLENLPTIVASGNERALQFGLGTVSSMDDLVLRSGKADRGGLIENRGELELENVSLQSSSADDGGAIYNSDRLTLRDCSLVDNEATRGGALFNDDGEVWMFASSVAFNDAEHGGGIYGINGDLLMHDGSFVHSNTAERGGGMYFQDASFHGNNFIFGGSVESNIAQQGGGVYLEGGALVIEFNGGRGPGDPQAIQANLAVDGGGVYVDSWATLEMKTDNRILDNGAQGYGGGVYNLGHVVLRETSAIEDNGADNAGGIYNAGVLELFGAAKIFDNSAQHSGGGVYNTEDGTLHIWDNPCRIEHNHAVLAGGSGAGGGVVNFGGVLDFLMSEVVSNTPNDVVEL